MYALIFFDGEARTIKERRYRTYGGRARPHTGNVISYCVMMSEQYHDDDECSYWTQRYSNDGVAYEMVDGMRCRTERE